MTTFALTTSIMSLAIFAGFLWLSIRKFGLLGSYSAYASKWTDYFRIDNHTHVWSIVTIIVALLLSFGTIEAGDESPLQFLGFFAPLYLWIVAFTPEWETNKKQHVIHTSGAIACALVSVLWACLICGRLGIVIGSLLLMWVAGIITKSIERALVFWAEMGMFLSIYVIVLIGG